MWWCSFIIENEVGTYIHMVTYTASHIRSATWHVCFPLCYYIDRSLQARWVHTLLCSACFIKPRMYAWRNKMLVPRVVHLKVSCTVYLPCALHSVHRPARYTDRRKAYWCLDRRLYTSHIASRWSFDQSIQKLLFRWRDDSKFASKCREIVILMMHG